MSTTVDILREARGLVARGWTQGSYARDEQGKELCVCDDRAVSWCTLGAIREAQARVASTFDEADRAEELLGKVACDDWAAIPDWNDEDGRTQADVLNAYDRAIQLAEQEAAS